MSDTPRMKAAQMAAMEHKTGDVYRVGCDIERELNAVNERISRLNDYVAALETAGDEMAKELSFGYDVDMWNKAKEAKP